MQTMYAQPVPMTQPAPATMPMAQPAQPMMTAQPMGQQMPMMAQPMMAQPMMAPATPRVARDGPLKQGWLIKEPVSSSFFGSNKMRWIVVYHDRVVWQEAEGARPLGELALEPHHTEVELEDDELMVRTDDRTLTMHPSELTPIRQLEEFFALIRQLVRPEVPQPQTVYVPQAQAPYVPQAMPQPQPVAYVQQPQPQVAHVPPQQPSVVVVEQQPTVVVVHEPEVHHYEEEHHHHGGHSGAEVALGVGAGLVAGALIAEALHDHSHRSSHSSHSSHSSCSSRRSSF